MSDGALGTEFNPIQLALCLSLSRRPSNELLAGWLARTRSHGRSLACTQFDTIGGDTRIFKSICARCCFVSSVAISCCS